MERTLVLVASVALVGLLAFLTFAVLIDDGLTIVVVLALLMLALLVFGVLGALTSGDDE